MRTLCLFSTLLLFGGCISAPIEETFESDKHVDAKDRAVESQEGISIWNTYYYVPTEPQVSTGEMTTLYSANCEPIAQVPASYSDSACIEGTGRLKDGRVVNYASVCNCGRTCPEPSGVKICWSVVDGDRFPWGKGARNNPLVPMRSIAVDRNVIPLGSTVYIPRWSGVQLPSMDGFQGFVHDGCFRADDVGSAVTGRHIDIFTGPTSVYRHLNRLIPTRTTMAAKIGQARCNYLESGATTRVSPPAQPEKKWLGSPCDSHRECTGVGGESGYCHKDIRLPDGSGVCTASCEGTCPDRIGAAPTFCVASSALGGADGGMCVARSDAVNGSCSQWTGFTSSALPRFLGNTFAEPMVRDVCLPAASVHVNHARNEAINTGSEDRQGTDTPPARAEPEPSSEPAPAAAIPVDEPCGSLDYQGLCRGDVVEWCDEGSISRIDCARTGETCGYIDASIGYYCQSDGSTDSNSSQPTASSGNEAVCQDSGLALSDHNESCSGVAENTWRCACSQRYQTPISQVCRNGAWITYTTNPDDCLRCNGTYTSGCEGD